MPRSVIPLIVLVSLALGTPAPACGPYSLLTYFWDQVGQELPIVRLADGEILPSDRLRPLEAFVVYRWLTDNPIRVQDRALLTPAIEPEPNIFVARAASPSARWLTMRGAVFDQESTGSALPAAIPDFRWTTDYQVYRNCLDDAFVVATETLESRGERWGPGSDALREWIAGQDQVFANCGEGEHIPAVLDSSWPQALRFDRDYQIAAALLYAERWAEAEDRFRAIAEEPRSPWQATSAYVVARTLLRQGKVAESREQLEAVAADPAFSSMYGAAGRLLRHVRYRLELKVVHAETRSRLLEAELPDDFLQLWRDYLWGLDRASDPANDLDLWITALTQPLRPYEALGSQPRGLAMARAKTLNDRVWRFAALTIADSSLASDDDIDRLIRDTASTPESAVESSALAFHRARLFLDRGRFDEAEAVLDWLRPRAEAWPLGTRNRIRMLDARIAPDLETLLETATAAPFGLSWSGQFPADFDMAGVDPAQPVAMDLGVSVLQQLPARTLADLASTWRLPARSKRELLSVAFIRALIVGDHETLIELIPRIEQDLPALAGGARTYRDAAADERAFVSALVLLWTPTRPWFNYGVGDHNRAPWGSRGWWCGGPRVPGDHNPLPPMRAEIPIDSEERDALRNLEPAPIVLAGRVFSWAASHPDDPRVPEALHRLVVTTRWACGQQFGPISKRAFDRLHRLYPKSSWAEKTPYWFGSLQDDA